MFKTIQMSGQQIIKRFSTKVMPKYDRQQLEALNEKCYLVDETDRIIGEASKKQCHVVQKDGTIPLHRAFSVFLFNTKGDLLVQKRSDAKITYPNCYTNACCSHPLVDYPGEDDEQLQIGIKRAAQRRLNYELGIPKEQIPLNQFKYLTRIHYYDSGDGNFGEHEIDYILFLLGDVDLKPNPNEVSEIRYIPRTRMDSLQFEGVLTPWFRLILKNRLKLWWDSLDNLNNFVDDKIHKLKD